MRRLLLVFALLFIGFSPVKAATNQVVYTGVNPAGKTCGPGTPFTVYYSGSTQTGYLCKSGIMTLSTSSGGGGATTNQNTRQIAVHFDGGGSAITGTTTTCQRVPYAGTINGWYIDSDVSGSGTLGVRSVAFASYTGTSGYSGYTDVTGGGTAPVITSATNAIFSNLTSWVTSVTAGQIFCFQLSSVTTSTVIDVYLQVLAN